MRVLHVDAGREYRGGQNQVRLLARELARAPELEQRVVTKRQGELARRLAAHGIPVRPVPWGPALDPRALWHLARAVREFEPAILHAHDSHALELAYWARRLSGRRRRAILLATRRVDFHLRRGSVWRRVDRVIAISRAVQAILVGDGCAADRITLIPSGIDPDEVRVAAARATRGGRPAFRSRLGLAPDAPLAVNVAALVDHKDHRTLIRAARAARAARPDLHWVIAGDGALRRALERDVARLDLADRVHLVGYVADADALIAEADVFVMSSKEEGLGSVVLHALALGKPVVATRGGGLPEIVPAPWLSPVGDAEALAQHVLDALEHPAPSALPPECTAAAMARSVLALYRSLV